MTALLVLGFFIGLKHALEADHVAAVMSLSTRSPKLTHTMRIAAAWGLGHTASLMLFGTLLLALDLSLPDRAGDALEAVVGLTLIVLGLDVLRRLRRKRVHFHVHEHDGLRHVHAHAHTPEAVHDAEQHRHAHPPGLLSRALVVGGIHGLAGTAGLTLLSLQALHSVPWALIYLALFGLGSILGMVCLTTAISLPLRLSGRQLTRASGSLEAVLGVATVALGSWIVLQRLTAAALG